MKVSRIAILLFATVVLAAKADETNLTIDGITYSNVVWRSATPATVSIFHKSGAASLPLEKLPKDLQERFGYDPQKAADYRTAQMAAQVERQESLRRQQEEQDAAKQRQAELEAEKREGAAKDSAARSARTIARKEAAEAATKKREADFLASLGPVRALPFSYAGGIRRRSDGKYSVSLIFHDTLGGAHSIYCLLPRDGITFLKLTQSFVYSRFRNQCLVYGRPLSEDSGSTSTVIDTQSFWLVGVKMVISNGKLDPSW
jgi:hypothetical protein